MSDRHCPYCQQVFRPSRYHPQQAVYSQVSCQRRRQREYHRDKLRSDPVYAETVRGSRKEWPDAHPGYQRQYWQTHAQAAERSRRPSRQHLQHLLRNTSRLCEGGVNRNHLETKRFAWVLSLASARTRASLSLAKTASSSGSRVARRRYAIRASLCAAAVMALGAPSLARIRRKKSPNQDWLLNKVLAAMRKAVARRFLTRRVRTGSTLPPLCHCQGTT